MTTIREDFEVALDVALRKPVAEWAYSNPTHEIGWRLWQEAHKQYEKRGKGRPPKLNSKDQKTVDRYALLCKMMRLKKSPTTEAVRMVIFDGVSVAKAAEANGIKVRGVYTAVNRMKEAFSMAKIVAEQKINW